MEIFKVVIDKPNDLKFAVKALIKLGYADRTYQYKVGTHWLITDDIQGYWCFRDMYPDRMWESTPTKTIDELWKIINTAEQ